MTERSKLIEESFHTVTPYMIVKGASEAIKFYKKAFGATELTRILHSDGRIMHAEIKIGDSPLMLVDENAKFPEMRSSPSLGGSPIQIFLYVPNVDALFAQALAAGAKEIMPVADSSDGDRRGGLEDPFGFVWWVATHIKDVPLDEMHQP